MFWPRGLFKLKPGQIKAAEDVRLHYVCEVSMAPGSRCGRLYKTRKHLHMLCVRTQWLYVHSYVYTCI